MRFSGLVPALLAGILGMACSSVESVLEPDASAPREGPDAGGPEPTPPEPPTSLDGGRPGDPVEARPDGGVACVEVCDDFNPCTEDMCAPDGTCVHHPAPDGTVCDDGVICTEADVCRAGTCQGEPFRASPRIDAIQYTYGAGNNPLNSLRLHGEVAWLSGARLVFLDPLGNLSGGSLLTLVEMTPSGLQALDRVVLPYSLEFLRGQTWNWTRRFRNLILPLESGRFALVFPNVRTVEVFETAGDQLQPLGARSIDLFGRNEIRAGTSLGDRMWLCGSRRVDAFRVRLDGSLEALGSASMPNGHQCEAVDVTSDGAHLFVATARGVLRVSVEAPRPPQIEAVLFSGRSFVQVAVGPRHIAVQEFVPLGVEGPVEVYDLDAARSEASPRPVNRLGEGDLESVAGFGLTETGLLMHVAHANPSDRRVTLELRDPPDESMPSLAWRERGFREDDLGRVEVGPIRLSPWPAVALLPERSVLRYDPASPSWAPVTGPEHGGLMSPAFLPNGEVAFSGAWSSHRGQVQGSVLELDGGRHLPREVKPLRIEFWADGQRGRLVHFSSSDREISLDPSLLRINCIERPAEGGPPALMGDIVLPEEAERLLAGQNQLGLLREAEGGAFELQVVPLHRSLCGRSPLRPRFEGRLVPTSTSAQVHAWTVGSDPSFNTFVLVRVVGGTPLDPNGLLLDWFVKTPSELTLEAHTQAPGRRAIGATVGTEMLFLRYGQAVGTFRRNGTALDPVAERSVPWPDQAVGSVLHFDDEHLYLSLQDVNTVGTEVLVLSPDTLLNREEYRLPFRPTSVAFSDRRVIFGSEAGAAVGSTTCF